MKTIRFLFAFSLLALLAEASAQEATPTVTPTATEKPSKGNKKVWTIDELIGEKPPKKPKGKTKFCNGGRFQPCICYEYVTRDVKYRPAVTECKGNAAVVLRGKYTGIFSVVVRDNENRDRWPLSGFGGCTPYERDVLGLNKCSAFKVQDKILVETKKGKHYAVNCLGASGYSKLFKKVTRITAKLSDTPNSNNDPLVRWCLRRPGLPLN